jgi:hypothetical protein
MDHVLHGGIERRSEVNVGWDLAKVWRFIDVDKGLFFSSENITLILLFRIVTRQKHL